MLGLDMMRSEGDRMRGSVVAEVLMAAFALCMSPPSLGAKGGLPADLASAAADYDRAQVNGDKTLLNRLLANDYHLVNGARTMASHSARTSASRISGVSAMASGRSFSPK